MTFFQFYQTFKTYPIISIREIAIYFPNFDAKVLVFWQKKGYLLKIKNGYYRLKERVLNENELFFIASQIYSPSYLSLETALSYYGFIPEGVFSQTAITTLKTQHIKTPIGRFNYRTVKSSLFFGYRLKKFGSYTFKIADPAKALLDYLYLNPHINTEDDFFELRFNVEDIFLHVQPLLFETYLSLFQSKALEKRAKRLWQFLQAEKNYTYDFPRRNSKILSRESSPAKAVFT